MATTRSNQQGERENQGAARAKTRTQNAVALLKNDHRTVENLFEEYEHARRAERKQSLVEQICEELTLHAQLEEQEFYPVAQQALGDKGKDLIDEARVEHSSLKWLIEQIEQQEPESELYAAKVTVLKEYVQHHVKEEEKEIFPSLRKTDLDLDELGQTLLEAKQELQARLQKKTH